MDKEDLQEIEEFVKAFTPTQKNMVTLIRHADEGVQGDDDILSIIQEEGWEEWEYGEECFLEFGDGWKLSPVEQFGGEGQGDDWWVVLKLEQNGAVNSYWEVPGWYASHAGHEVEISNLFQVEPYEKTETAWRALK